MDPIGKPRDLIVLRVRGRRSDSFRADAGALAAWQAPQKASAVWEFARLCAEFPNHCIGWYDRGIEEALCDVQDWPGLLKHDLELLHGGFLQRCDLQAASVGYIDYHSPFLLPPPIDRRFPTWLVASCAGIARTDAILALGLETSFRSLSGALSDLAARGLKVGLFPYSEPRLAKPGKALPPRSRCAPFPIRDIALLAKRLYGTRKALLWLGARALFERKVSFPGLAAISLRKQAAMADPARLMAFRPPLKPGAWEVDVVIATLGRPAHLLQTLADLSQQTLLPKSVIIVEQIPPGMEEQAIAGLDARHWPFKIRHTRVTWTGPCRSRNLGLRQATAEWLLFLDDDVRIPKCLLDHLVAVANSYCVKAVAGSNYLQSEAAPEGMDRLNVFVWSSFTTCVGLVNRSLALEVGGFDEVAEGFAEDAEFGTRLRRAGHNVIWAPGQPVLHLKSPAGGFRVPSPKPWDSDNIMPRPAPETLYYRLKHSTLPMRRGYTLSFFLGRLQNAGVFQAPAEISLMVRQWRAALKWANTLLASRAKPELMGRPPELLAE